MAQKMDHKKILAFIPARGGSKGLPRKNVKDFAGKPLIAWTIEQAKAAQRIDWVVVSTEDKEISAVAKKYGATVVTRPKSLAGDSSSVMDALKHAVEQLKTEDKVPDAILILQATSPLRTVATIDRAVAAFRKNFDSYDSLVPLFRVEGKMGTIRKGIYEPKYVVGATRRQDMKDLYRECGTVFLVKTNLLQKGKGFGKKMYPFVVTDFKEAIDIDTLADFTLAEQLFGSVVH